MRINSIVIASLWLFLTPSAFSLPEFLKRYENVDRSILPRQAGDNCCASCSKISQSIDECPTGSDILCGCDLWVAGAPSCEACLYDVGFNSSYATNPGPSLELFWAWCQCPKECHNIADAIFGASCSSGTDKLCISKAILENGYGCHACLKHVDEWFASFFKVWIEQAKELLSTGVSLYPGISILFLADCII